MVFVMPSGAPKSVNVLPSTCARIVHPNVVWLVQNSAWAVGRLLTWEPGSQAVECQSVDDALDYVGFRRMVLT